jgi:hypothetical protein
MIMYDLIKYHHELSQLYFQLINKHIHYSAFFCRVKYIDRLYITKDVILKLIEYGGLNQTALSELVTKIKNKPTLGDIKYD